MPSLRTLFCLKPPPEQTDLIEFESLENKNNTDDKLEINKNRSNMNRMSRASYVSQNFVDPDDFDNFVPPITDDMLKPELALWQKAMMVIGCIICGLGMIGGVILIIFAYNQTPNKVMLFSSLPLLIVCSMILYGLFVLYGEMEEESIEDNVAEVEMYKETVMTQLAAQQSYED